jgi:hypothetical protein
MKSMASARTPQQIAAFNEAMDRTMGRLIVARKPAIGRFPYGYSKPHIDRVRGSSYWRVRLCGCVGIGDTVRTAWLDCRRLIYAYSEGTDPIYGLDLRKAIKQLPYESTVALRNRLETSSVPQS